MILMYLKLAFLTCLLSRDNRTDITTIKQAVCTLYQGVKIHLVFTFTLSEAAFA